MSESFREIVSRCLASGELYKDEDFPARHSSLFYNRSDPSIEWKRPSELCNHPKFIIDGATKSDLDQGELGNCWYLAAASTLSVHKDLFERVVPIDQSFEENYCGIFRFKFWRFGKWIEMIVDDRLPTRNGRLVFCHNRERRNEFWSPLMEKAYAKMFGSYEAIEAGLCQDALVDFTGGIGEELDIKNYPDPAHTKLFIRLKRISRRNSLLCAAIYNDGTSSREVKLKSGLLAGHAYSIIKLFKIDLTTGSKVRLVQLRNPWGKKEWKGNWSDGSEKWKDVPEDVMESLDLKNKNDGDFYMCFSDFMEHFHAVQICHLTDPPKNARAGKIAWTTLNYHGEWIRGVTAGGSGRNPNIYFRNPQYYCVLDDADEGDENGECTLLVSLIQKYTRIRKTIERTENTEEAIGFDLFKYKGREPKELDGFTASEHALRLERKELNYTFVREVTHRFELEPGTYCVIPNAYDEKVEAPFLLRFATEKKVKSGEVGNENNFSNAGKPREKRKIDELFDKHAGHDKEVDARELRKILNEGLIQDKDEDFSKELCRELIQSITGERRGLLDKGDCKMAWRKVKKIQATFNDFDTDKSGTLDGNELRNAFKSLGYSLGKKAQGNIVKKYCDKKNHLTLDDFVLVVIKMENSKELFRTLRRRRQREAMGESDTAEGGEDEDSGPVEMSRDEFMEMHI